MTANRDSQQNPDAPARSVLNPLEQFALWALAELREHGSDIDGGDAQEKLAEFGVVQMVEVTEQCHTEDCPCAEFGFPTQCYRDSAFTAQRRASLDPQPSPDGLASRDAGLEEAAKVCEQMAKECDAGIGTVTAALMGRTAQTCAERIRALKESPSSPEP